MGGFGKQPAGSTNAGYGQPRSATAQSGALLRDTRTSESYGARKIDPVTRDYVLDTAAGRLLGMPDVQQIVHLSVHTDKGSSAVKAMGNELRKIDRITTAFERKCLSILTDALKVPIDLGYVEVLGFTAFKAGPKDGLREGQAYGRLRWRDLTTNEEREALV